MPTRELALQTSSVVKELGKHINVQCMVSTGGTSLREDIMRLYNEVHIVVATPGRVLDLANKNVCNLKGCQMMVMDEADKLLCPEFQPIIEELGATKFWSSCDMSSLGSWLVEVVLCGGETCGTVLSFILFSSVALCIVLWFGWAVLGWVGFGAQG